MQKIISVICGALLAMTILATSGVSASFAAPMMQRPVPAAEATSNIDQVQYRYDRRYRHHRHYRDHRNYNRRDWNRRYGWNRWDNRRHQRWSHNRYWKHRGVYTGGPGRSHQ